MRADEPGLRRAAEQQFRRDVQGHISAIRTRYFIAGETQDTAFMFVPSELIFGDIHERFDDIVQFAHTGIAPRHLVSLMFSSCRSR